jgi:2-polyprenyl-6-methoxyphenol hydroxylase-like FAD-dependent oxidoreductase
VIRGPGEFAASMTIETDVVVVGAGPIGIVTALELARSGVQVALIESGLERTDQAAQGLATFDACQDDYFHSRADVVHEKLIGLCHAG